MIEKVNEMGVDEIPIPVMHNIVESALEQVKPVVAKSYRDYRNYKQETAAESVSYQTFPHSGPPDRCGWRSIPES